MRMTEEHFVRLRNEIMSALDERGFTTKSPDNFPFIKDPQMSWAWHVYHYTQNKNGYWMNEAGLSDAHIETALKRIFSA